MKKLLLVIIVLILCGFVYALHNVGENEAEKLSVATAFGKFQGFLMSSNDSAVFRMLSSGSQSNYSPQYFRNRINIYTNYDWQFGASVFLRDSNAELHVHYSQSFGTVFYFLKENGEWRVINKTSGFESSSLW